MAAQQHGLLQAGRMSHVQSTAVPSRVRPLAAGSGGMHGGLSSVGLVWFTFLRDFMRLAEICGDADLHLAPFQCWRLGSGRKQQRLHAHQLMCSQSATFTLLRCRIRISVGACVAVVGFAARRLHSPICQSSMPASASGQATTQTATPIDPGCSDTRRFELELEFVQLLANPEYLTWLAQSDQLKDPALVKFLDYLQYWLQPEYAAYIM